MMPIGRSARGGDNMHVMAHGGFDQQPREAGLLARRNRGVNSERKARRKDPIGSQCGANCI